MEQQRARSSALWRDERWWGILGLAGVLAILHILAVVFRFRGPALGQASWFVALVNGFVLVAASVISSLSMMRYRAESRPQDYWLSVGFSCLAVETALYALTFPGLAADGGALLAHSPATAAVVGHLGVWTVAGMTLVAFVARRPRHSGSGSRLRLTANVAGWMVAAVAVSLFVIYFESSLPPLFTAEGVFAPFYDGMSGISLLLLAAASVLAAVRFTQTRERLHSSLSIGMMLVAFGLLELVIGGRRFGFLSYLGQVVRLSGYMVLMLTMLADYSALTGRLRESEERYRGLFENMSEGLAYCRMIYNERGEPEDWVYLAVNGTFGRLTGLADVVGKRATQAIPGIKEATPEPFEIYGRVARTGVAERFDINFTPLRKFLSISVYSPAKDNFVAVFDAITDRKQAEEKLRENEDKHATLFDRSPIAKVLSRLPGPEIVEVNDAFLKMFGFGREELVGRTSVDLGIFDPAARAIIAAEMKAKGLLRSFEVVRTTKAGERRTISLNVDPLTIGGQPHFLTTVEDITAHKQAEAALRETEERFSSVLNSARDAIVRLNVRAGRYEYFSPATEAVYGFAVDEMMAMSAEEALARVHPDDHDTVREARQRVTDVGMAEYDVRWRPKSGEYRWISVNSRLVRDAEGRPLYQDSVVRDITARKRAEEALEQSESLLRSYFDAPGTMQGIVEVVSDDDVRHVRDNAVTAAFAGLTPETMRNKLGSELGEPRDILRRWVGHYRASQKTGRPVTFEYDDVRGERRAHLSATVTYLGTPAGGPPRFAYVVSDISPRRQAEERVRRQQAEIEALLENTPAGLVLFEGKRPYEVLAHNRYYQELFGEPFRSKGMVGLNVFEYAPAVEAEGIVAVFDEVVRTKQPKSFLDFPYNSNPPNQTWFNWQMSPLIIDGEVVALVSMSLDVTDRHRAEERLRESEEKFRAFTENTDVQIIMSTIPEGLVLYTNPSFEAKYLYPGGELVGGKTPDLYYDLAEREVIVRELQTKGFINSFEMKGRRKDGTWFWNSLTSRVIELGGRKVAITAAVDITARKQAEAALQEAKDTLELRVNERTAQLAAAARYSRDLIESSLDPLVTISAEGKVTDVNEATVRVTGMPREQLIGSDFSNYFTEPEKARAGYQQVFARGLVTNYPLTIRHRDGSLTDVLYNASVYKDKQGKVIGVFAAARDVTESRRAEEALKDAHASLEQKVVERTAALSETMTELKRSNEELERFAYVASHDLQEPLRTVSNYVGLLRQRYQGKLDERADKYINYATAGAKRMSDLIQDLLAFSRLASRKEPFAEVNMDAVLQQAKTNLSWALAETGATVESGPLPRVMGDRLQLVQLFQNLISNAVKFRTEAPPAIRITAERIEAKTRGPGEPGTRGHGGLETRGRGDAESKGEENGPPLESSYPRPVKSFWRISVADNGIGIDPRYHAQVFELFKRLHQQDEYPGTGIGLAVCRKIVERHGGELTVDSTLGRGSTFTFTLPA